MAAFFKNFREIDEFVLAVSSTGNTTLTVKVGYSWILTIVYVSRSIIIKLFKADKATYNKCLVLSNVRPVKLSCCQVSINSMG